ncbi:MAG: c-type cytochrome [Pseudomonadota bacterium]
MLPSPHQHHVRLTALLATLAMASGAAISSDIPIATGKMIGDTCASCHGTRGRSFDEYMPSLAGINRDQLVQAMQDYREDRRASVVMNRIAKGYNDREILAVAEYFSRIR